MKSLKIRSFALFLSKRQLRFSLLASVLLFLTSCLGDLPPNAETGREVEANARLLAEYESLQGAYKGYVRDNPNGEADIPARLDLILAFEPSGRNEDGETKMVAVLRAQYTRLDIDSSKVNYSIPFVRFYKESGQIVLLTQKDMSSGAPGVGYLSVVGTLIDGQMRATLTDHRGLQGRLELVKYAP